MTAMLQEIAIPFVVANHIIRLPQRHDVPMRAAYLKSSLNLGVFALGRSGRRREQVGQKRQEKGNVLGDELAEVHVSESPVHEECLRFVGVIALRLPCRPQHLCMGL